LSIAPAFAERVVLKNGQTYEGEIVEETEEYIHLKTNSETVRIHRADIDLISTQAEKKTQTKPGTEKQRDVTAEEEDMSDPIGLAKADAEKGLSFVAGCALNLVGLAIIARSKVVPPQTRLVRKSPEYVAAYSEAYARRVKTIEERYALAGCLVSCAAIGGCALGVIKKFEEEAFDFPWPF
jgi:hypothetical protein